MSLLFVGTYGEKLGHVDGKGKGLYVLRFSHSTLSLTDGNDDALMGKPQLGTQIKNSTYMVAHRERVAYVGYELSSQAAAFGVDEQTGAIVGQPLCVCNVLCGVASPFLSGEAAEGGAEAYAGFLQDNTNEGVATLKEGHGRFVSSDQKTSIAAVRVAPGAGHLLVSSRIVKAPGAISAIPLTTAGLFVDDDTKQPIRITSSIGVTPRDFNILVDSAQSVHALVANQDDDKIVVLRNGHEATLLTESVPTPVCLCWTPP